MNNNKFKRYSKEEIAEIKKRNQRIINKVKFWQQFKYVKSLTCKKENCDGILDPRESRLKVILRCPKCGFVQTYVPRTILKTKLDVPDILIKNQSKMGH